MMTNRDGFPGRVFKLENENLSEYIERIHGYYPEIRPIIEKGEAELKKLISDFPRCMSSDVDCVEVNIDRYTKFYHIPVVRSRFQAVMALDSCFLGIKEHALVEAAKAIYYREVCDTDDIIMEVVGFEPIHTDIKDIVLNRNWIEWAIEGEERQGWCRMLNSWLAYVDFFNTKLFTAVNHGKTTLLEEFPVDTTCDYVICDKYPFIEERLKSKFERVFRSFVFRSKMEINIETLVWRVKEQIINELNSIFPTIDHSSLRVGIGKSIDDGCITLVLRCPSVSAKQFSIEYRHWV